MELGLKGRNAVITGGTRGIGKSIARALAKEGVNVVLLARSREALERTAEEIRRDSGVQAIWIPADVKSIKSVKTAAADVVCQLRTIHILVNNAGGPIRRMDRQIEWADSYLMDD